MTFSKISIARKRKAFSLIEVVLAIGIFMITILALVGLLGPTLKSVDEVEQTDAIASVVNSLNAFLQQSPEIAPSASKFDAIFNAVANNGHATIFVFQAYLDEDSTNTELKIGFYNESVGPNASVIASDFGTGTAPQVAGPIYRVVLTPSSVLPTVYLMPEGNTAERNPTTKVYSLQVTSPDPPGYPEGYFAMEVRIFAEEYSETFTNNLDSDLTALAEVEPIFTYNAAVVR
jgi:type II secretory pathway pseudopilin PulG